MGWSLCSSFRPHLQGAVERAVAVHDDEAEAVVVLQQLPQRLRVELLWWGDYAAGE